MLRAITLGAFLILRNGGYIMSNERISYRIIANVGILAKRPNDWSKEVNVVSWNEGPAKLDIREWSPDHDKMSKGITLTVEETQRLLDSLLARDAIGILQDLSKPETSNGYEP